MNDLCLFFPEIINTQRTNSAHWWTLGHTSVQIRIHALYMFKSIWCCPKQYIDIRTRACVYISAVWFECFSKWALKNVQKYQRSLFCVSISMFWNILSFYSYQQIHTLQGDINFHFLSLSIINKYMEFLLISLYVERNQNKHFKWN